MRGIPILIAAVSVLAQAAWGAVNAHVEFYRDRIESVYDTTAPYVLDESREDSTGMGRARVDLQNGVLRAWATAKESPQFTVIAQATDLFVLSTEDTTPVTINARMKVNGTGLIVQPSQSMGISATVGRTGGGGSKSFVHTWQAGVFPVVNEPFTIEAEPTFTLTVTPGVPFELYYSLRLDTRMGGTLDFDHTAVLEFDLPQGGTIQSTAGYVPEPAVLTLLIPAVGLMARRRAR